MNDWTRTIRTRQRNRHWRTAFIIFMMLMLVCIHAYAADETLKHAILMCESSNRHYDFHSNRVRYGDDGISRGIAQFRKETFYEQAAVAKKAGSWPFGKPKWFSEEQQLWLLNDMLDRGLGNRWTCYRKLKGMK